MIVITTPTGNIGRHVLSALLAADERVRVVARDPSRLAHEARDRVEVVQGSIDDRDVLNRAFAGAECVFWCVPQSNTQSDVLEYYMHYTRAACDAIRGRGVGRVVAVSSGGRGRAKNAGPISALHAMEEAIEGTGVAFRALRNGNFMENLLWQVQPMKHRGALFYPLGGDLKVPTCAARDIAASAVRLLRDRTWTGRAGLGVHGPEDLSFNQVARLLSDGLGKQIRFQEVPGPAYKASLVEIGRAHV